MVDSKEEVTPLKSLKASKNSKKSKKFSFQDEVTPEILSQTIVDNNHTSAKSASKASKNSKKSNKTKEEVLPEGKKNVEPIIINSLKNEDSNNTPNVNANTKKNKAKEAKEKKNKADKKTRNFEEEKNNQENKEQLPSQVHTNCQ